MPSELPPGAILDGGAGEAGCQAAGRPRCAPRLQAVAHKPTIPHLSRASAAVQHQNHHRTAQGKSSNLLVLLLRLLNLVLHFAEGAMWSMHPGCPKFAAYQFFQFFKLSPGCFGIGCVVQYCNLCATQPWRDKRRKCSRMFLSITLMLVLTMTAVHHRLPF